jgi:hypothetical protein
MEKLSKRDKRLAKKKAKDEQNAVIHSAKERKRKIKTGFIWLIIIIIIGFVGNWTYEGITKDKEDLFPFGAVHWHSSINIITCGESRGIEHLGSTGQHFGGSILHTHGDNTYHLEGSPKYMSQVTLGAFFKSINVPFSNEGIWEYNNGDVCPDGSIGSLQVKVNEQEVLNATGYNPQDGDVISIVFE